MDLRKLLKPIQIRLIKSKWSWKYNSACRLFLVVYTRSLGSVHNWRKRAKLEQVGGGANCWVMWEAPPHCGSHASLGTEMVLGCISEKQQPGYRSKLTTWAPLFFCSLSRGYGTISRLTSARPPCGYDLWCAIVNWANSPSPSCFGQDLLSQQQKFDGEPASFSSIYNRAQGTAIHAQKWICHTLG